MFGDMISNIATIDKDALSDYFFCLFLHRNLNNQRKSIVLGHVCQTSAAISSRLVVCSNFIRLSTSSISVGLKVKSVLFSDTSSRVFGLSYGYSQY